jgi:hypothetical protein
MYPEVVRNTGDHVARSVGERATIDPIPGDVGRFVRWSVVAARFDHGSPSAPEEN